MSFGENISPFLGRGLMALFFALIGLQQVQDWAGARLNLLSHGLAPPDAILAIAVVIEFGCSAALLLGFRTRLAALALFVLTLAASVALNDFWKIDDAEQSYAQMQLFLRNVAIAGGLLVIVGMGAGRWSYDTWRGDGD
jgi:putative oxidoreductase